MNFEATIDKVIARESGYVDNPVDKGGPTNFGITQAVAIANGYTGAMKDMPVSFARQVYRNRYIAAPCFDKVALVDDGVAAELIDTGVNMGPGVASLFFQRLLNGFNYDGSHYADVFVDGRIGDVTVGAFRAFARWRGQQGCKVFTAGLNSLQGERYVSITENDKAQRQFLYGWLLNRVMGGAA